MKIKINGELTLHQLKQSIFEQLALIEDRFLVRHAQDITIYLTPTNGFGSERYCIDERGQEVRVILCKGPYRPIADDYELY